MDGPGLSDDDRRFMATFTDDGISRLKENIKMKLTELTGDYIDDELVEYVTVLLRNGRCKDEARDELNVFLESSTGPFVSWLWGHIASNLHLYAKRLVPFAESLVNKKLGKQDLQSHHMSARKKHNDPQHEKKEAAKSSRDQDNEKRRGSVHEKTHQSFLRSAMKENWPEGNIHQRSSLARQFCQPAFQAHNKRSWQDERRPAKVDYVIQRDTIHPSVGRQLHYSSDGLRRCPHPLVKPPVRIFQSALRDLGKAPIEPAPKRLRLEVLTPSAECFLLDRSQIIIPLSGAVARVASAAAEAAVDVLKIKCVGNAVGSEGHDMDAAWTIDQPSNFGEDLLEEEEFDDIFHIPGPDYFEPCEQREYGGELTENITLLDEETWASNHYVHDLTRSSGHHRSSSITKSKNPCRRLSTISRDKSRAATKSLDLELPATAAHDVTRNVSHTSVNVDTWRPPHHDSPEDLSDAEGLSIGVIKDLSIEIPNEQLSSTAIFGKDNAVAAADAEKVHQRTVPSIPGSCSPTHPCDDADSHIIFVSNVHFAATKETLSQHFNQFGEVSKVIFVTDIKTRQRKGSAFIEFLQKESAEKALSLDGTYFMSRVLKVVRRSAARHEGAPLVAPTGVARTSLLAPVLRQVTIPRGNIPKTTRGGGIKSALRASLPLKPAVRSLQWKRDSSTAQPPECVRTLQKASLPPRNFSYIRSVRPKVHTNP